MKTLKKFGSKILALLIVVAAILIISSIQWVNRESKTFVVSTELQDGKIQGIDTSNMTEEEINALMQGGASNE